MKADNLQNWDKVELARILADKYCDADDLLEAFPSICKVETFEINLLNDYIEENWMLILPHFNVDALCRWLNVKEKEEESTKLHDELLVRVNHDVEMLDKLYYMEFIALMGAFKQIQHIGYLNLIANHES